MSNRTASPTALLDVVRRIATEVAAVRAAAVDAEARFPSETLAALRDARVLSAPLPREWGGHGCDMRELAALVGALAPACASSAMVLAMHYIQLACLLRHHADQPALLSYMRQLADHQWLLASMTSENGTFGETRTSICAVEPFVDGAGRERFNLNKDATTGSYCLEADAILVTARRAADAPAGDQVLVLVRRADCTLTQTGSWDTLGMRGTRSPGFQLVSSGPAEHVLPQPYADISALTMVPYSHILWSALWTGISAGAQAKAAAFVRAQARKTPGSVPPAAARLAALTTCLQTMRHQWQAMAGEFDQLVAGDEQSALTSLGWALRLNNLKIACSEMAPQIVHGALQIVGIQGYRNDGPYSLGRAYRDALSGSLMVSNDRIAAKNASMLLVFKDV